MIMWFSLYFIKPRVKIDVSQFQYKQVPGSLVLPVDDTYSLHYTYNGIVRETLIKNKTVLAMLSSRLNTQECKRQGDRLLKAFNKGHLNKKAMRKLTKWIGVQREQLNAKT